MGGVNHLFAILDLLKLAVSDSRVTYVHIISGQDILVRNYNDFEQFFLESKKIYMTCKSVKNAPNEVRRRLENWVPFSNMDSRKKVIRYVNNGFYMFQKILHRTRNRLGEFQDIYKGMVWCSLPISVAEYIVKYNESHSDFLSDLMHTLIPEEFFFQTIIMNSPFKEDVVDRNLRYTDWTGKNGSRPSFLDLTDFNSIVESGDFFARKIDLQISDELLIKIERSQM